MKYFVIIALLAFLVVEFYMDIMRYIISPDYWQGLQVVPIIMAAEIFMGIYFNLSFWYKLNDETYWGAIFSFIGCAVLFAMNIIFVPRYGYMACAWASFAGYFTAMTLSYFVGQKRNAIDYNLKEIFTYVALFAVLYGISYVIPVENSIAKMAINTLLLAVFVGYFIKKDLPLKNIPVIGRFFR
jgi:O-antigen/teichoic acid export membrane protein